MTLKTGVDMQTTIRSPRGISGMADTQLKLAEEVSSPYSSTSSHSRTHPDPLPTPAAANMPGWPLQHRTLLTVICRLLSFLCRLVAAVAGPPRQPEQEGEDGELQQPAHQRHLARAEARGPHQVVVPDEEAVGRQHEAAAGRAGPGHTR